MLHYNEHGQLVSTLWDFDTRIQASNEELAIGGGLAIGRVDIGWLFWLEPNIHKVRFQLYTDAGLKIAIDDFEQLKSLLMAKEDPSLTPNGLTYYINRHTEGPEEEPVPVTNGIKKLELEYHDYDGWIPVTVSPASTFEFNIKPDMAFKIMIVDASNQYVVGYVDPFKPLPLIDNKLILDIRSTYYGVEFLTQTRAKITGSYSKVFIKYL